MRGRARSSAALPSVQRARSTVTRPAMVPPMPFETIRKGPVMVAARPLASSSRAPFTAARKSSVGPRARLICARSTVPLPLTVPPPPVCPAKLASSSRDPANRPRALTLVMRVPVSALCTVMLSLATLPVMRGSASVPVARASIRTGPARSKASTAASRQRVSAAPSNRSRAPSRPRITRSPSAPSGARPRTASETSPRRSSPSNSRAAAVRRSARRSTTASTPTGLDESTSPARLKRSIRPRARAVGGSRPVWR